MQAELEQSKFVFFKKETNSRNIVRANLIGLMCVILILGITAILVEQETLKSPKETKTLNINKNFAVENIEVFKFFSAMHKFSEKSLALSYEQVKKEFPSYEVSFKEFKSMTGWMRKDTLLIHFDLKPESAYISYNGLNLAQAYELKEAFDSVASDYETTVKLEKDGVNIVVSNYKPKYAELLKPMAIIPPLPLATPLVEDSKQNQIKKLNEQLESVKLNNLIIQEKIKQAELLKKLPKS